MPTEREAYLSLSLQVALSASWSTEHGIVSIRGNHDTYPALSLHLTAEQGAELAASLIRSVLASDPDGLSARLVDAAGEALAHHWRDAIPATDEPVPVGAST
ncbi:hypothetical protein [Jiangella asiatica]|uniref:Uncharacterized protein n=1 Tax=Jiangella asiatica TaxID=2530372 RepID=A0A4R5D6J3_9ACTN|nr:hypothetical protein [Jiangella asiatica]TDE08207.1 hypothetical protein E1269_18020 [Jiangella asiatica]